VTLVGEAELCGEPCEVTFSVGKALHRRTHAEAHAVAGDRGAGCGAEYPAQMMRRDGELLRHLGQRALRVGCERLPRAFDERTTRVRGRGAPRRNGARIVLLERPRGEYDRTLDEFVTIVATACCCQQQPVLEIDLGRGGQRPSWKRRLPPLIDATTSGLRNRTVQSSPPACGWS
jgi:hypothetical protein